MHRVIVAVFIVAVLSPLSWTIHAAEVDWSYEGENGPGQWSKLSNQFHACGGNQQSPIAIHTSKTFASSVPEVFLELEQFKPIVTNDGHNIIVESQGGDGNILYSGKTYKFGEMRIHQGSGHTIDDRQFPIEAHFVLASEASDLFVLEGPSNPTLQTIIDNAPSSKGQKSVDLIIDPMQLIPIDNRFFRYKGSLTVPPCTENVTWHIYKQTMTVSKSQIEELSRLYSNNFRPAQPLNRRYVLEEK
jgi:carbonic anhydrase